RSPMDLEQATALAGALGVPLSALLPEEISLPYQIVRSDGPRAGALRRTSLVGSDGRTAWHPNPFYPLADLFVGRHLEPLFIRTEPPRHAAAPMLFAHHEQEFLSVLHGQIEFLIDTPAKRVRLELRQGDSIAFWSCLPHLAQSLDGKPAETLNVYVSSPGFPESGPFWLRPPSGSVLERGMDRAQLVGRRIRRLRGSAGLTTAELAGKLGVKPRRLQLAEEGTRTLPIEALLQLSRFFAHPLRELIGESARPPYYSVVRSEDIRKLPALTRRGLHAPPVTPDAPIFRPLAGGFPDRRMLPVMVEVQGTDAGPAPMHEHHGEEFLYVFEGRLELTIRVGGNEVTEVLRSGDSCYLDSSVPHSLHSHGHNPHSDTAVQALSVFWSPLGEDYLFVTDPASH
ncbi:MAG TPA: cupin domain-containing protein, partial [Vicinamibacterales bacterium]|nr:cupin domain-containing protein [Vicinamibacterales bacterium]